MGFGRKTEENRSLVRTERRWVDNRVNGYNHYIMSEEAVLKVAQDNFTIFYTVYISFSLLTFNKFQILVKKIQYYKVPNGVPVSV
jgi:hypothetical protein